MDHIFDIVTYFAQMNDFNICFPKCQTISSGVSSPSFSIPLHQTSFSISVISTYLVSYILDTLSKLA